MSNHGEISIYGHCYGIKDHKDIVLIKNSIYEKCLPHDKVLYKFIDDTLAIEEILERSPKYTLAVVRGIREEGSFFCLPLISTIFNQEIKIDEDQIPEYYNTKKIRVGDMWNSYIDITGIHIQKYIGNAFNLHAVKDYIKEYIIKPSENFPEFYKKCLLPEDPTPLYTRDFVDLKHLDTFSIDNSGTRDVDDCISIDFDKHIIYVHIVDIVQNINLFTDEDIKAAYQGNTVYLPDLTLNCFPRELSDEKLSLNTGETRNVITIEMKINKNDYSIDHADIYSSEIINKNNYTYENFEKNIEIFLEKDKNWILKFMKKWKLKHLEIPVIKLKIRKGMVESIRLDSSYDQSHSFVETLMVAANSLVATYLESKKITFPKVNSPRTLINEDVEQITENNIVNTFLKKNSDPERMSITNEIGHFGVILTGYTHFTSPIRRQKDTVIHRLLAGYKYDEIYLNEYIKHLENQRKSISRITEWYYSIAVKKYLREFWKEPIEGWVTDIYYHGIDFLIPDWLIHGYIHVSKIISGIRWNFENNTLTSNDKIIQKGTKILVTHEGIGIINIKFMCIKIY